MKKFFVVATFIAAALLASCTKVVAPPPAPPEPPEERPSQFLTLVTLDEFERHPSREGWEWATVPPVTEAEIGQGLIFIFGFPSGTGRAELRSSSVVCDGTPVPGLPLVIEHDEARFGGVRGFEWTPKHVGRHNFELRLVDKSGKPLPGAPLTLEVSVRAVDKDLGRFVNWFNVTYDLTKEIATGDVNLNDSRNRGLSFNWSVKPTDGVSVRVSISLNSWEIYNSEASTHAQWVAFSSLDVGRLVFRLTIDPGGCIPPYERTVELNLVRR